jgi:hypothetical protein
MPCRSDRHGCGSKKSFDIAQAQVAQPKAPITNIVCQPNEPIGNLIVFSVELSLVAVTGLAEAKRRTSPLHWHVVLNHCSLGHLSSPGWPHHFFAGTSATISASIRSSAYIRLIRRISSSSSFIRAIIDASMPSYLARHL